MEYEIKVECIKCDREIGKEENVFWADEEEMCEECYDNEIDKAEIICENWGDL